MLYFKNIEIMAKKTCVIIDDDAFAIAGLEKYIENIPSMVVAHRYTDPVQAML